MPVPIETLHLDTTPPAGRGAVRRTDTCWRENGRDNAGLSQTGTVTRSWATTLRSLQPRHDLLRQRFCPDLVGIGRIAPDPHARLEALDRKLAVLEDAVRHREARALDLGNGGLDHHVVAVAGRYDEARTRVDHRI